MRLTAVLIGVGGLILLLSGAFFYSASLSTVRAEDDHSDYRSQATLLEIGAQPIAGSIEKIGLVDRDYFKFKTLRGTKYTFTLDLGTLDDADFKVFDFRDRVWHEAENQSVSWVGGNKKLEWVAPTTGTYSLGVIGVKEPDGGPPLLGDYTLSAEANTFYQDQHGDSAGEATPLAFGSQYSESISPWPDQPMNAGSDEADYDHDFFSFEAKRGVEYNISTKLDGLDGLDVSVETRAGKAAVTHKVVAANNGVDSTLDWVAPNAGTYYVVISGTDLVRVPAFIFLRSGRTQPWKTGMAPAGPTLLPLSLAPGSKAPSARRRTLTFSLSRQRGASNTFLKLGWLRELPP